MRYLLLFSVLATLAGATSYQKIIAFIALQRERLNAVFGACFRRAPAVNTLPHLFLALGRDDLEPAFRHHARALNAREAPGTLRTVALDGKTLRGSFDHLNDRKAVHVLSAFASDAALILAHQELAGAPDEVAAVPRLMAELGVTGVLFTADALHCQKDGFAQAAATSNALLARIKENQPILHATLAWLCDEQRPFDSYETVDRGRHGPQEHRRVEVFDTTGQLDAPWQTLIACVARVSRLTYTKNTRSGLWPTREEVGYYPCQTRHDAKFLARAIPCSATIWMRVRIASWRNAPELRLVASRRCSPRSCRHSDHRRHRPGLGRPRDAEHEGLGHLTPPDLQPTLECSQQPIGVALRMFGLQPLEQLASRSRRIGVEPGPQLRRHRDERVRPAPATLLLRLGLRRRPALPLPPGRAKPRQERLDRRCVDRGGRLDALIGDGDERSLRRPHFGPQANRIQARAQHFDAAAHRLRRARVRQEPLAGRRWRMIALADPCALALLPGQLERGLEDVHEQPCRRVERGQSRRGRQPLQASIAHDAADHGAVLLLDEGLVVFAIGSTAREGDALRLAVIPYGLVDEHAVVVRVEPEQIEGHQLAQFAQHILEQHLLADQQRRALGPARGDIGQDERLHEAAARRRAAVGDQVRLDVAGRRVLPIGEGAHRDAAPERRRAGHPASRSAARLVTEAAQCPVDRCRAHRQQGGTDLGRDGHGRGAPLLRPAGARAPSAACHRPGPTPPRARSALRGPPHRRGAAPAVAPSAGWPVHRGARAWRACDGTRSPRRTRPGCAPSRPACPCCIAR